MRRSLFIVATLLLLCFPILGAQVPAQKGRIEGVVSQAGGPVAQAVVGAKITVTKVNAASGALLAIPGRVEGTMLSNFGSAQFPGIANAGQRGAPPPAPPGPQQQYALPIPPVFTDRDGKFVVPNLDEGAYRIAVTMNGYVRQEYGQRVFPGQGTQINLAPGQVLRDLTIRLTATGNVGGRMMDNEGQPAVGVPMLLLKAVYNNFGQRIFQNAGNARTNDRGEYRFFWVTPGRYYVGAGSSAASMSFGNSNASPNESGDTYAFAYYPGGNDVSRASAVDVKSGSELALDFVVPKQQLYTISGKIVDPNPLATASGSIPTATLSLAFQTLTGGSGTFTMGPTAYDAAIGTFVLRDVLPGAYVLQAAAGPSSARMPIEVTNTSLEGLAVVLDSGVTVNGRFTVEGGDMPPANTMRVQMRPVTNGLQNYVAAMSTAQAGADGSFTIGSVIQGQYRAVVPPSQDFYVKQLRFDRSEALNSPFEVSRRNSDSGTMEIVVSRNVGQIDGVIVDDRSQPVPGVQAVLIPDLRGRADLYRAATTDQTGRFSIRGITPGDYKLFAWESLENFGYFDPEVLRRADPLGKAIQVAESAKISMETRIIPAGQ
jgi:hypothetical protein